MTFNDASKAPSQIVSWLLDTRALWPANPESTPKEQMAEFATKVNGKIAI